MPTVSDFLTELDAQVALAERQGRSTLQVNAGDLHRTVGGYPPKAGSHHAMPSCCQAMWKRFDPDTDREVSVPPKKKGATLTLSYALPRSA
jgi:5-methylcytosine-specific restriction protein A